MAGVAGQDTRRVRPQREAAGVGEGGGTGAVIRCEDWPACPSGRRFPRTPETVIPKAESEALQARRHFRGLATSLV